MGCWSIAGLPTALKAPLHLGGDQRDPVRVKCPAQARNTMSPDRTRTQISRYGAKRTNHEAVNNQTTHII